MEKEIQVKYDGVKIFKFILYSAIGIFMFFVPITINGTNTIPVDHIVNFIKTIPNYGPIYSGIIVTIGGLLPFINPALLVTEAPLVTRFLIAVVSVSEILFFSASIPCMMATQIPLTMKDYIIIWIERVILSILITAPILHLIF